MKREPVPNPQEPVSNPRPESPQPPPDQEANDLVEFHNSSFEGVRQVARLLARHNEQGFQHIRFDGQPVTETAQHGQMNITYRALLRLALIGDPEQLSKVTVKRASMCGGVEPNPPFTTAIRDTPDLCDAGTVAYASVVTQLLQDCSSYLNNERSYERRFRLGYISRLPEEQKADVMEAALAAADYAYKVQNGEELTWPTLKGGAHAEGDLPT